jgi:nitrate/TMAO reductase-like tetraheme cytochrome c subunit
MMAIRLILSLVVGIVLAAGITSAENKYVGAKFCAACHKAGKGGTAYAVWEKSPHAKAFETLKSKESEEIAKKKGLKKPASESPECLKCHVTGGGAATNVEAGFKKEEGVTCEACHGAASAFKMIHTKGDLAKSKEAGLNPGDKTGKACETCHNAESPTHKPFKFAEAWAKIKHELPPKK